MPLGIRLLQAGGQEEEIVKYKYKYFYLTLLPNIVAGGFRNICIAEGALVYKDGKKKINLAYP